MAALASLALAHAQAPPAAEEDIREVRGLIELPAPAETSHTAWWIALSVVVAGLAAWGLVTMLRARQQAASPLGQAMQRLREIEGQQAAWDDERYAIAVADVLRHYVVAVHGIAAPQRTSQEFLQECMRQGAWPDVSLETLRALLRACDVAKFASGALTALERQDMLLQVRELILVPMKKAEQPTGEFAA